MFIYFLALSPACYMHPICRWEGFLTLFWAPPHKFLHLNAYFCSILLITTKKNPHNIDIRGEIHT